MLIGTLAALNSPSNSSLENNLARPLLIAGSVATASGLGIIHPDDVNNNELTFNH